MRQLLKTLEVHNDTHIRVLTVEEWQGFDPAMHAYDEGYVCFDPQDNSEYFVDVSGRVEKRDVDGWFYWGICPVLENEYKLFEQLLDKMN